MTEHPPRPHTPTPSSLAGTEFEEELNLLEYWRILVEKRTVLFSILAATVIVTMVFTFLSTPLYEATTTLQIERHGPDITTFKDVLGVDPAGYHDFYQTQYKIIQSRAVLHHAAERLDLVNHPDFLNRKGSPLGRLYGWLESSMRGSPDGAAADEDPLAPAVGFIEASLSVSPVRNSHLVAISFMDRDPVLAREVANVVADAYQQFNLESRYRTTEQASEFLTKEVARLQSEIGTLERRLQAYGDQKEILALSDGTQDISQQALADLNSRLTQARGHLAAARARYDAVRTESPDSLPEVLESPLIHNLKQKYAELERRYGQMAERFKPGWPVLKELEQEMSEARDRLRIEAASIARQVKEAARSEYGRAEAEVANLEEEVARQKREVQRVNVDAIEYAGLKSEIATRREVLNDLVLRQSQTETSGNLRDTRTSNVRVVERAETPQSPARPRKLLNLVLAVFLGTGFGVAASLLLFYLDNTVKTEQDLERYSGGAAILGHIPLFQPLRVLSGGNNGKDTKKLEPETDSHAHPRSAFAEAFKNLRTSLLLASPDHPPRHIVVTSCEPGDGKSTVATNLAIVLTQMGRRVLIVDADLRRPRVHRVLGLSNDVGLSSYLTGNASLEQVFQDTDIPGLHVLTSGPIPPNPSELLGSPRLATMLECLVEEHGFDHVVFDSPPALQVADGVLVSTRMDTTILVVRAASTSRDSLAQGVARLRQARARLAGTVLNAVSDKSGYYYYRGYKYDRRYYDDEPQPRPGLVHSLKRRRANKRAGQG